MAVTFTTRAAFWFDASGWTWIRWTHADGNRHAAIYRKALELGARGYDTGNADHYLTSEYPFGTR